MSKTDAAKYGVGEIAVPIISSTATTLAAFAPLLFWDSIMGEFMKFLPITLIAVLGSSLFVGLVINPVFAALFMKKEDETKGINWKSLLITIGVEVALSVLSYLGGFFSLGTVFAILAVLTLINAVAFRPASRWFQNKFLVWLEGVYLSSLKASLTTWKPFVIFGSTVILLFASFVLVGIVGPKVEFFPANVLRILLFYFLQMKLPIHK